MFHRISDQGPFIFFLFEDTLDYNYSHYTNVPWVKAEYLYNFIILHFSIVILHVLDLRVCLTLFGLQVATASYRQLCGLRYNPHEQSSQCMWKRYVAHIYMSR